MDAIKNKGNELYGYYEEVLYNDFDDPASLKWKLERIDAEIEHYESTKSDQNDSVLFIWKNSAPILKAWNWPAKSLKNGVKPTGTAGPWKTNCPKRASKKARLIGELAAWGGLRGWSFVGVPLDNSFWQKVVRKNVVGIQKVAQKNVVGLYIEKSPDAVHYFDSIGGFF